MSDNPYIHRSGPPALCPLSNFTIIAFHRRMDRPHATHDPARRGPRARRPRAARACDICRAKKNKCDELFPCSYCRTRNLECVYQGQQSSLGRISSDYVKQLEDQVKRLEIELEQRSVAVNTAGRDEAGQLYPPPQPQSDILSSPVNSVTSQHTRDGGISGINRHTRDIEFYGSSSSVALLSHVQHSEHALREDEDDGQLVSRLHNPAFRATSTPGVSQHLNPEATNSQVHHNSKFKIFLDNFFSSIHYIHPILDRADFFERCEQLWAYATAPKGEPPTSTFVALYHSVLSLGAIVGPRTEDTIEGVSNLQWSRRFFEIARKSCNQLGLATDLEMVQCYFILVCNDVLCTQNLWHLQCT